PEDGTAHRDATTLVDAATAAGMDLRRFDSRRIALSFDETTTLDDLEALLAVFARGPRSFESEPVDLRARATQIQAALAEQLEFPAPHRRTSSYLEHPVFNSHHAEHEMLRYMRRL